MNIYRHVSSLAKIYTYRYYFVKVGIYVAASNSRNLSMHVLFLLHLNYGNKQMVIKTCKILPFSKFRGLMPAKWPFFISRIRASLWINTPFFAEMGTSVVYVLDGSGCVGVWVCVGGISVHLYHIRVAFFLLLSMNISRTPHKYH